MNPNSLLKLNAALSDRVRLAIMAALATANEPVEFMTLLESLELTRGNLSAHAQKLEEAGLISVKKEFVGKKPRTSFSCTDQGRKEIQTYLAQIESVLALVKKA